jgi:hypothetical protein
MRTENWENAMKWVAYKNFNIGLLKFKSSIRGASKRCQQKKGNKYKGQIVLKWKTIIGDEIWR